LEKEDKGDGIVSPAVIVPKIWRLTLFQSARHAILISSQNNEPVKADNFVPYFCAKSLFQIKTK
jgi:hypothetical protein